MTESQSVSPAGLISAEKLTKAAQAVVDTFNQSVKGLWLKQRNPVDSIEEQGGSILDARAKWSRASFLLSTNPLDQQSFSANWLEATKLAAALGIRDRTSADQVLSYINDEMTVFLNNNARITEEQTALKTSAEAELARLGEED